MGRVEPHGSGVQSYRNLLVWQAAMDLVQAVYEATHRWPHSERFALTDQIRRAVISVPANVAEGYGRTGPREYLHHCSIANGSLCEVETYLMLARRLGYVDQPLLDELMERSTEIARMLHGLMRRLRAPSQR